ncbi:reverse transcriptase domain-containing protein [Tanacetum coccineum]
MPFGLKNAGATYQRLVDTIFEGQIGRNLEAYVDDMVIKNKTEQDLIKDIEETLLTLKKVNMKMNPKKCLFRIEEGKFLGYIVTSEGIRANPEKTKAATERVIPCRDTLKKCTNKKDFRWMEAVKEAFRAMNRLMVELPTLTAPIKDEELLVYLSVANEALSAVLLVERNGSRCDSLHTMTGDNTTSERTPSSKAILDSKEVPESSKSKENKQTQTLWSRQTHESYTLMEHPMIMDLKQASS